MKSAFITRSININSPFSKILKQQDFEVNGLSFIEFRTVEISSLPTADWIFFYSKNGVRFFFNQVKRLGFDIKKLNYKWATIGQGSATYLAHFNIKADFIGSGEPSTTSKAFLRNATNQQVLFPRASNSKKSIQYILANQIQAIDLVIYENHLIKHIKKRTEDFLVFTSPMNAQAYFNTFQLDAFQKVIAIGQTTAKALVELGINDFVISNKPSEASLAKAVLSCL